MAKKIQFKKILIISEIPIFNMKKGSGIKVLSKTLDEFINRGYKIDLIYPSFNEKEKVSYLKGYESINDLSFDAKFYYRFSGVKYLSFISKNLMWLYYYLFFRSLYTNKLKYKKYDFAYGIGAIGPFLISNVVNNATNTVARHLGVASSYERYKNPLKRFLVFPSILGYKARTDAVIITDDGTKGDEFIKRVNKGVGNVFFLKNGIDKSIFRVKDTRNKILEKHGLPPHANILLAVSRLSKLKRVDRIIKLMPSIIKNNSNAYLLIVGDGPLRKKLEDLAFKLNVTDNVFFIGTITHSEISGYYNACDIFISMYDTSNAGNPLFEAMLLGCCIITLDIGDTKKFLPNNYELLFKPREITEISSKVSYLLYDKNELDRIKISMFEYANENIKSWEDRMEIEFKILNDLSNNQ